MSSPLQQRNYSHYASSFGWRPASRNWQVHSPDTVIFNSNEQQVDCISWIIRYYWWYRGEDFSYMKDVGPTKGDDRVMPHNTYADDYSFTVYKNSDGSFDLGNLAYCLRMFLNLRKHSEKNRKDAQIGSTLFDAIARHDPTIYSVIDSQYTFITHAHMFGTMTELTHLNITWPTPTNCLIDVGFSWPDTKPTIIVPLEPASL